MDQCIYRGATKLFIPLPQIDAYHCYHPEHPKNDVFWLLLKKPFQNSQNSAIPTSAIHARNESLKHQKWRTHLA